jgi:hypothetical protein
MTRGMHAMLYSSQAELRARGVEFTQDAEDHGYGLVTRQWTC